jgi:hypothetical protein
MCPVRGGFGENVHMEGGVRLILVCPKKGKIYEDEDEDE